MTKTTTIPISERVKEELRKMKGNRSWDELLIELISAYRSRRMENLREKLRELLELDYEEIKVRGWAREYY